MKKRIIIASIMVFALSTTVLNAQKFDREAYQAQRNAYITAEISLTSDEAAVFIPLENEFQNKKFEIGRDCRKLQRKSRSAEGLTEEEQQKLIDCNTETRLKEAQLEKEYNEKFKKILSIEKICKYQEADAKFMREFMRGRGERRGDGANNDEKDDD